MREVLLALILWGAAFTATEGFSQEPRADSKEVAAAMVAQLGKGLLGHWRLNEGGGSIAYDSSGLENHGTICRQEREAVNGVWEKPNGIRALAFDGSERYAVIVPHSEKHNLRAPLSVAAWIWVEDYRNHNSAFFHKERGFQGGVALHVMADGKPQFNIQSRDGGEQVLGPAPVPKRQWHHVAGVYDGDTLMLFLDGKLVASQPLKTLLEITNTRLAIGTSIPGYSLAGKLREVRLYKRALSEEEVEALMRLDALESE
jgi:endonuclease YncB( thermonuclease family)